MWIGGRKSTQAHVLGFLVPLHFMTTNGISFGAELLASKCQQTFSQVLCKNWHGLTPMGHQEPAAHLNITYQTHMEHIQWSGGN